jgi:hypothetical protein
VFAPENLELQFIEKVFLTQSRKVNLGNAAARFAPLREIFFAVTH